MSKTTLPKELEQQFDERFGHLEIAIQSFINYSYITNGDGGGKKQMNDIKDFIATAVAQAEERVKQQVLELIKLEMDGAEELQENIKIYNGDETTSCKLCGCDPVHQREYLIEKVSSL